MAEVTSLNIKTLCDRLVSVNPSAVYTLNMGIAG